MFYKCSINGIYFKFGLIFCMFRKTLNKPYVTAQNIITSLFADDILVSVLGKNVGENYKLAKLRMRFLYDWLCQSKL